MRAIGQQDGVVIETEPPTPRDRIRTGALAQLDEGPVSCLVTEYPPACRAFEHAKPEHPLVVGKRAGEVRDLQRDLSDARRRGKPIPLGGNAVRCAHGILKSARGAAVPHAWRRSP